MAKPRILLTRRWPDAMQARLARDHEAGFYDTDALMTPETEVVASLED